jgi:PAS domain S-box-containing protein
VLEAFAEGQERLLSMVTNSPENQLTVADVAAAPQDQFKKLVEVISRSQHNYRELIDNLDQAVFTLSIDGEVRVANRRLSEILQVPFSGLIGHSLTEFVETPSLSDVKHSVAEFIGNGFWSGPVLVRLKNESKQRYFDCWLQALSDDGHVVSVTGWARDVTAQYETEIRFTELFESLREGVFFATTGGRILDGNPALIRLLGFEDREDLQIPNLRDLYVHPEDLDVLIHEIETRGSFRDREIELRRKDGQLIYCLASGFAIRDTFGNVARLQGTLVDVTERREIERQLHQEQEFVRRLVANFPDLIAVLDRDGRFTYVSPSVRDILGGAVQQYRGESFSSRSDPEDQPKIEVLLRRLLSGEESSAQFEFRARHTDGGWKILRVSAGPFVDEHGKVAGVVASARDVTESKLIEQQMIQREKFAAMGQMMAGAAHELNNPLTAILGVGELLRERSVDDAAKRQLDLVMQQARRAAGIVQNLLAFARPSAKAQSDIRLEAVVQQALQVAQPSLQQKNIAVKLEVPSNLPSVVGDAKLLTQVFLNIIGNAEQAISSQQGHGLLTVSLAAADGHVSATIVDDGPGISAANVGKIFDPFFTTKRPGGGTGLGLTISLAIVKELGGTIDVESPAGSGAMFQVILPASGKTHSVTSNLASPARSIPAESEALLGHTVLIVDDEESIREIVQEGLAVRGMKVDAADSAEKALTMLESNTYDVIVCDFNLPHLSGGQLLDRLRKERGSAAPPFVFMTGELVDAGRIAEASEKGVAILQKPFRVPDLAKLLASLLETEDSRAR